MVKGILKARAWLDLTQRKSDGELIDSKSIKKHQNDVFRLFNIIDPQFNGAIPDSIVQDLTRFLDLMLKEAIDVRPFGISTMTKDQVLSELRRIYTR